jgi:hypothetical protein
MVQLHPTAIVDWYPMAAETYHGHGAIRAYHVHVLVVDPAPS